ncbi:MAG: LysR substrate-binding domain-containing protein, partial [Propionicimonas sp.]|nr:LysR substrate-binding domain-containing protein [Propionicimonas sp.]
TEAGRLLADCGEEVAVALARAQARWDAYRGATTGTVSVASLPSAAAFLLPAALADLAAAGIQVRCDDVDVAEHEYAAFTASHDLVIAHSLAGPTPAGAERLATTVLAREPLDIALPAGHRLAGRSELAPEDLVDESWVAVPRGYPFDTVLQRIAAHTGRDLRVVQRVRDNRLVEALVAAGGCVAVLPRFTTPSRAGVVLRPLAQVRARRYIVAVMRPDRAERLVVVEALKALRRAGEQIARAHG